MTSQEDKSKNLLLLQIDKHVWQGIFELNLNSDFFVKKTQSLQGAWVNLEFYPGEDRTEIQDHIIFHFSQFCVYPKRVSE